MANTFKYRNINKNSGFTLLEIMMVASLLGIAFLIFYNFLGLNFTFLNKTDTDTASYFQATNAMNHFARDAQQYQTLRITQSGGNYVVQGICAGGYPDSKDLINATAITDNSCYYYTTAPMGLTGQFIGSKYGALISDVKTNVDLLDQSLAVNNAPANPNIIKFIRITFEVFPGSNSTMDSIKLSRILRLSH
ncbi:MAG: hypothetical protein A4E52_01336 [Pelotomaculum sp. PtaB.Bin013]|uniref:Type II secretion system GspH family protein n=1 Tax=Pelotomaculum isophthalicicum JI TaxID=947010 RepID=A0A9X4H763_9FIRM|nr:type II secretion system protein [Pelotomaculum isophthalicicum]MDF9409773.1 type II secretion system GspH family protein [Pelotomaculum isophthalicicum JI]OPX87708.1 MAG: hypothetical protein A4E52_01336 [Pelotomaculum sp. PtaB.Bin013]